MANVFSDTGRRYTTSFQTGTSQKTGTGSVSLSSGWMGSADIRRTQGGGSGGSGGGSSSSSSSSSGLLQSNSGESMSSLMELQNRFDVASRAEMVRTAKELGAIASSQRITESKESIAAQTEGNLRLGEQQGEYTLRNTDRQGEWNLKGIGMQTASQEKIAAGDQSTRRYESDQERASRLETTKETVQGQRDVAGINAQGARDVANINVEGQLKNTKLTGGFNMGMQAAGFRQENRIRREDRENEIRDKRLQAAEAARMNKKIGLT